MGLFSRDPENVAARQENRADRRRQRNANRADRRDERRERQAQRQNSGNTVGQVLRDAQESAHNQAEQFFGLDGGGGAQIPFFGGLGGQSATGPAPGRVGDPAFGLGSSLALAPVDGAVAGIDQTTLIVGAAVAGLALYALTR